MHRLWNFFSTLPISATQLFSIRPVNPPAWRALALVSALAVTACASNQVEQDYLPETDFSPYRTYDWHPGDSQIPGLEIVRLQRLAGRALAEQGYEHHVDDPDMWVSLSAFTRPAPGGSTGVGISFGVPLGSRGRIGVGGSQTLPTGDQEEGVLVMDISNADSGRLIWRGTASGIALQDFRMTEEPALRRTLERLVQQFPPEED